jgi:hypothetical protein
MHGRDYKYITFHYQDNGNAEHCEVGEKMVILDEDVGYDEVYWLIGSQGSTQHDPAGHWCIKSASRLEGLWT